MNGSFKKKRNSIVRYQGQMGKKGEQLQEEKEKV